MKRKITIISLLIPVFIASGGFIISITSRVSALETYKEQSEKKIDKIDVTVTNIYNFLISKK